MFADSVDDGQMGGSFLLFTVGGVAMVVGMFLASLGFTGAAGETMPLGRDSLSYLTNGVGVLGVGRTGRPCDTCGIALT